MRRPCRSARWCVGPQSGYLRVDAVLVEQVDGVNSEALERTVHGLPDVLGAAGEANLPAFGVEADPNLVALTTWSRRGARASPTSSSFTNGPYTSAVRSQANLNVRQFPLMPGNYGM